MGKSNADVDRVNPRTRRVRQLILDTAAEVLLAQGAFDVTAHRVAERADVARTTIYRHWPDQASLLLATIDHVTAPDYATTSVGNLRDDLETTLGRLRKRLAKRDVRSVFGGLAAYAGCEKAFADAQRRFIEHLTQPVVDILEAGRERRELGADLDLQAEAARLVGPILHQHLLLHNKVADETVSVTIDRWLASQGTH